MSTTLSFTKFLHEHGILSTKQTENYPETENQDNASLIFQLADFIKSLTPSDCYDLALRLFLLYQQKSKAPRFTEAQQATLTRFFNTVAQKYRKTLLSSFDKLRGFDAVRYVPTFEGSFRQESQLSHQNNPRKSRRSVQSDRNDGPIYERLYKESEAMNSAKLINEEKKYYLETKDCTFQPKINKSSTTKNDSFSGKNDEVFKRLQKSYRRENQEMFEKTKAQLELKECTFHPNILQPMSNSTLNSSSVDYGERSISRTFERLHSEHSYKKQQQMENEILKQTYELAGCTFTPKINDSEADRGTRSARNSARRSESLYADHFEKKRSITKMMLANEDKEIKECTFKPALIAKMPETVRSARKGTPQERLLEWQREKEAKLEEKQREKLLQESASKKPQINANAAELGKIGDEPAHERLYREGSERKNKQEELEKKVLGEIGVSFTPKTNVKKPNIPIPRTAREKTIQSEASGRKENNRSLSRDPSPNHREELKKLKERLRGKPSKTSQKESGNQKETETQKTEEQDKENAGNTASNKVASVTPSEHKKIFQQSLEQRINQMKSLYYSQGDQKTTPKAV